MDDRKLERELRRQARQGRDGNRRYFVRIRFEELMSGEIRRFTHDVQVEADSPREAREIGLWHFERLGIESRCGFGRKVLDCKVTGFVGPDGDVGERRGWDVGWED